MIRILVNGARGKMGSMAVAAIDADPALTLVGCADKDDNLTRKIKDSQAEGVVDFTVASAGYRNFITIIEAGAHPVIGTSGFDQGQVVNLRSLCRDKGIGGLIAPNFAVGAVLLMKFAREAAKYMPHVEIIEAHHERKLDAPSGTAIRTAELIAESRGANPEIDVGTESIAGVRGGCIGGVPIHSLRLQGILAQQQVIFGAPGQTLTIEHNSIDRASFMGGVCLAAAKIIGTKDLFYGLEALIG